jgi:protein-tyrosine phosphatase
MFQFFNKKPRNTSLDWIAVDMHSHILPGIDDGSPNITTSMRFVKRLQTLGYQKLICTPHIFREVYPANSQLIATTKEILQRLVSLDLDVQLEAAAEYMLCPDFDNLMKQNDILCLPGRHLLIEMSYILETKNIDQYIFDLRTRGFAPILAHPERYVYYHKDFQRYKHLKTLGCFLQLNLLSLTGYYGKEIKDIAKKLLKENLIDFVGTDLHHDKHLEALSHFANSGDAWKTLGGYPLRNGAFIDREVVKLKAES